MNGSIPTDAGTPPARNGHRFAGSSVRNGVIAAIAMTTSYTVIVAALSGSWQHLADQTRQDWIYLAAIITGFGLQVALMTEIHHRHRLVHGATVAGSIGAGASAAGMVACCAHHLAELAPFVAATGAATFLTDQRTTFMIVGIALTTLGVAIAALHLRHSPAPPAGAQQDDTRCDAAA